MRLPGSLRSSFLMIVPLIQVITATAFAADDDRSQGKRRHGPPPEAIEACSALTAGDACSFTGRNDEELAGTCFAPQDRDLVCKPEGHEGRESRAK